MSTEWRGPFHVEERPSPHGKIVRVQSPETFSPWISALLPVSKNGRMYELPAFHLKTSEKLVLSMVGEDDVVIDGGGDAA